MGVGGGGGGMLPLADKLGGKGGGKNSEKCDDIICKQSLIEKVDGKSQC